MELDKAAVRRVRTYGRQQELLAACWWKGRPAVVALTSAGVAIGASGVISSSHFAPVAQFTAQRLDERTWRLTFYRDVADVVFDPPHVGEQFVGAIAQRVARREERLAEAANPYRLAGPDRLIQNCLYLGGAYLPFDHQERIHLVTRADAVELWRHGAVFSDGPAYRFALGHHLTLEISGPGRVTSGGGFVGGGSGLIGAAEGIAIATLLNKMTTRTSIITVLTITDPQAEGFFLQSGAEPAEVRRHLSPFFIAQRQIAATPVPVAPPPAPPPASADLVSQLAALAQLRRDGDLTDDEYAAAKASLLAGR